jgi:phage FluMu protein Com
MLKFRCPHCDQKIGLSEQYANKQVRCARCKQLLVVPAASTENDSADKAVIRFQCRTCRQKLKVSQKHAGANLKCPKCGTVLVVPQVTEAAALGASSSGSTISDGLLESGGGTGDFLQELERLGEGAAAKQPESSLQFQQAPADAPSLRCSSCGAVHSADRKFCSLCGQQLTEYAGDGFGPAVDERAAVGRAVRIDNMAVAILAAALFSIIGGVGWCVAARSVGTGWLSFMAVGVFCLSGAGFYLCTQNRGVGVGILAVLIGFMGVLNAKTLIAKYVTMPKLKNFMSNSGDKFGNMFDKHPMKDQFYEDMVKNEDFMFAAATMQLAEDGEIEEELVDDIVMKRPADENDVERTQKIKEAKTRIKAAVENWDKEKKKKVAQAQFAKLNQKYMDSFMQSQAGQTFSFVAAWFWSFSCQDIVWFPLGMFCAYKIARNED